MCLTKNKVVQFMEGAEEMVTLPKELTEGVSYITRRSICAK